MNRAAREDLVRVVEFDGDEWLHFRPLRPDVAIIRGTTADARGNISMEHEAAPLGAFDLALAARNASGLVIAQVKRRATAAPLPTRAVHVPCSLVDVVVVDPDQMQATETPYDPACRARSVDLGALEAAPFGIEKVIAPRRMELAVGDVAALGFGVSALVPRILVEEEPARPGHLDDRAGPRRRRAGHGLRVRLRAHADAIIPSPQQFTFFQGAGFDCGFVSFLQIDRAGNVNVSRLAKRPYLTAGVGGFIDITARGRRLVFGGTFTTAGLDVAIEDGASRSARRARSKSSCPRSSRSPSAAGAAVRSARR